MKNDLKRYFLFCFATFCFTHHSTAQSHHNIQINFQTRFQQQPLHLDSIYIVGTDTFQIQQFKFYITGVELKKNNKCVFKEKNSVHLINLMNPKSCTFSLKVNNEFKFDEIQFNLGIDSLTNSKGISVGALDPTLGMYWAWHSGFINFKLEGKYNSNKFEFHLGGFRNGFYNLQTTKFLKQHSSTINITFDLFEFLSTIDLEKTNHVMSPSRISVELAQKAIKKFSIR